MRCSTWTSIDLRWTSQVRSRVGRAVIRRPGPLAWTGTPSLCLVLQPSMTSWGYAFLGWSAKRVGGRRWGTGGDPVLGLRAVDVRTIGRRHLRTFSPFLSSETPNRLTEQGRSALTAPVSGQVWQFAAVKKESKK